MVWSIIGQHYCCILQVNMWRSSAQSTSRLFASPVRKVPSPATTAPLTDVRVASCANKVGLGGPFQDARQQNVQDKDPRGAACETCGLSSCLSTDSTQKCSPTTDTECSCQRDFLCSNSRCSRCVKKNKCRVGETPQKKERKTGI